MLANFFHQTTYLNTMGDGTQNLMRVFLMFSWRVVSSKHQVVCSLADGPAVGSTEAIFEVRSPLSVMIFEKIIITEMHT